jgi:hypothetical protein
MLGYGYSRNEKSRDTERAYYWEIVKVVETITRTFEEEGVDSNMPEMLQIARAAV